MSPLLLHFRLISHDHTGCFFARALVALCGEGGAWISGNVIGVDGAEDIAGGR